MPPNSSRTSTRVLKLAGELTLNTPVEADDGFDELTDLPAFERLDQRACFGLRALPAVLSLGEFFDQHEEVVKNCLFHPFGFYF